MSRAELEADLVPCMIEADPPFFYRVLSSGPDGRLIFCSLSSGTSSAGVVSVGSSGDPSLHHHSEAPKFKEMVRAKTSRYSALPWAQRGT